MNAAGDIWQQDPMFVNAANHDYRLQTGSPCIDQGTDLSSVVNYDIVGTVRALGGGFDMGAYEIR